LWRYITYNVAAVSESPRQDGLKIKPLTEAQARRLIDAMKGHRLEALYRIALSLGLRRGEILGLLWDDVDLDKKVLRITGQVQTVDNVMRRISSTKTEAGARELPLPEVLINVLRRHWKLQQDERSRIDDVEWHDDGLVFPSNPGTPMWPRNLIRQFRGVLRTAGLPERTRFDDLRFVIGS
jgi:integrase